MTKLWVGILAGIGGFAVGVYVTKLYAENKVTSGVDSVLEKIPFISHGGAVENTINNFLVS